MKKTADMNTQSSNVNKYASKRERNKSGVFPFDVSMQFKAGRFVDTNDLTSHVILSTGQVVTSHTQPSRH